MYTRAEEKTIVLYIDELALVVYSVRVALDVIIESRSIAAAARLKGAKAYDYKWTFSWNFINAARRCRRRGMSCFEVEDRD